MSDIHKYEIDILDRFSLRLAIDKEKALPFMTQTVDFFRSKELEAQIKSDEGDLTKTFIRLLSHLVFYESIDINIDGIKSRVSDAEGFFPVDGSCGVTIVHVDNFTFDSEDVIISDGEWRDTPLLDITGKMTG